MSAWCTDCGDEFDPVEYSEPPLDPDEPVFCSDHCADAWWSSEDNEDAYRSARYSAAPVWP